MSFAARLMKIKAAGLSGGGVRSRSPGEMEMLPLEKRVELILNLFDQSAKKASEMIYFVMYDIEHDRIRNYMAKYLLKKGLNWC